MSSSKKHISAVATPSARLSQKAECKPIAIHRVTRDAGSIRKESSLPGDVREQKRQSEQVQRDQYLIREKSLQSFSNVGG